MDYSIAEVCLLGVGIVFFGLVCLVGLIWILGLILKEKKSKESEGIAQNGEDGAALKVAVQAALAEYLQVEYQDIKIMSFIRSKEKT